MLGPEMLYTLGAIFLMFSSVMMVITVSPVVIEDSTGRSSDAGFVTAAFSAATVLMDLLLPRLLRSPRASWFLAGGTLVIAASAPMFAAGSGSSTVMFAAAAVRGVGFAFASVTGSFYIINLAPIAQQGKALSYYGLATTVPAMIAPAVGLVLLDGLGTWPTFIVAGLLAAGASASAIAGRHPQAVRMDEPVEFGRGVGSGLAVTAVRRPFVVSIFAMIAFGGLLSFVPLRLPSEGTLSQAAVFFFVAGLARAVSRWVSGGLIDRVGATGPLLGGAVALVVGGVVLLGTPGTVPAIVAALLMGAGHGFVLNAAYIAMIDGAGRGALPVVSTLWNLSLDGGAGLGALGLGVVAAFSLDAVFVAIPLLLLGGLPFGMRADAAARARKSDSG